MALYWNPASDMEQLLTAAFSRLERSAHNNLPLDIRQTDEAFWIEASVPGFRPEDVEITLDENVLTIRGTRHEDETKGGYVQRERQLTSVHRHVGLPAQVKAEEITASFENGILTLMVPRAQRAQPNGVGGDSGGEASPPATTWRATAGYRRLALRLRLTPLVAHGAAARHRPSLQSGVRESPSTADNCWRYVAHARRRSAIPH